MSRALIATAAVARAAASSSTKRARKGALRSSRLGALVNAQRRQTASKAASTPKANRFTWTKSSGAVSVVAPTRAQA